MARPRKPTNVLELKGAFKKDPARGAARAGEPKPAGELGGPPAHLSVAAVVCWHEIVGLAHAGTLCASDRLVMEYGSELLAQLRAGAWVVHPSLLIRFEAFLGKLGLTPADRSKVAVIKPKEDEDPYAEFKAG